MCLGGCCVTVGGWVGVRGREHGAGMKRDRNRAAVALLRAAAQCAKWHVGHVHNAACTLSYESPRPAPRARS